MQWGVYTTGTRNVTITLPITTPVTYAVVDVHWQSLSLTKSAPVKACITIAKVIHIGDKARIVLAFYAEITITTA